MAAKGASVRRDHGDHMDGQPRNETGSRQLRLFGVYRDRCNNPGTMNWDPLINISITMSQHGSNKKLLIKTNRVIANFPVPPPMSTRIAFGTARQLYLRAHVDGSQVTLGITPSRASRQKGAPC